MAINSNGSILRMLPQLLQQERVQQIYCVRRQHSGSMLGKLPLCTKRMHM